jgi:outer membrane protein assembly factor BamB
MRVPFALITLFLILLLPACKKTEDPKPKSSEKIITSFVFSSTANPGILPHDYTASITNDSIVIDMPASIPVSNLVATIRYKGVSLSPADSIARNYSNAVNYTVTAEDGSTRTYIVAVRLLSVAKSITAFRFLKADNSNLSGDVTGEITNDSIRLIVPGGTDIRSLVPDIQYTGTKVTPASKSSQDFTNNINYTVTAEDGSERKYIVAVGVTVNSKIFVGSEDTYFYALDGTTGKLIWKFKTNGPIYSSPTVVDNVVYFGSNDRNIYALNAETGSVKWMCQLHDGAGASPVVVDGMLYTTSYTYAVQGFTYAIDINTGTIKWQVVDAFPISASPTVAYGLVYIGNSGGGIQALDAKDGSQKWYYNLGITTGNACVKDGILYWGGEGAKLVALNALTGAEVWKVGPCCGVGGSGVTISGDKIFAVGAYGIAYAYDVITGNELWNKQCGGSQLSSPVIYDGVMYTNDHLFMYALDCNTGDIIWKYQNIGYNGYVPNPTIANGILYIGGNITTSVNAYDAKTDNLLWQYNTGGYIYGGPCVVDYNGNVYHAGISGAQQ